MADEAVTQPTIQEGAMVENGAPAAGIAPSATARRRVTHKGGNTLFFDGLDGLLGLVEAACIPREDGEETRSTLGALLKEMSTKEHESFWQRVMAAAGEFLFVDRHELRADGQPADEQAGRVARAMAELLAAFADSVLVPELNPVPPPSFLEALGHCQEAMLAIPDAHTQSLIARVLELICTSNFDGRDHFYGGLLMYLVVRCVDPKAVNADVARLHRVRHLLPELDWDHESIESMKMELMKCAGKPGFARAPHSAELLALFYTVHPSFTKEVDATIRNQVHYSRPFALKCYSTALYKAWKSAEGGTKLQVEFCVQEWIVLAIRTAKKSADKARAMLEEFHRHHHDESTNELLCHLYGPVLWRCLKVANCQVRENATRLLLYTFPLLPKELGVADKELELSRQLRVLRETLEDPSEPVRRVGIGAACTVLKNYWEMLPPSESAEVLTALMTKCARDKKAPLVRAAVAEGFGLVLTNPLSHPTMAAVLPQVAELMNDRSPVVRVAFINLLSAVSNCRGFSVQSIVSNEALLLRLTHEHAEGQAERLQKGIQTRDRKAPAAMDAKASPDAVAKAIARLLAPSLFHRDLVEQVQRCHFLMREWPLALIALLTHLQEVAPPEDRARLAAALFHYGLREAAQAEGGSKLVSTMLRVVGVLLEGSTGTHKNKRKLAGAGNKLTKDNRKELDNFVYENVKEADFLHLLQASQQEGAVASRLGEDLLFALSALDPTRLPGTAELVRHELTLACRGGGSGCAASRLTALMRTASKWGFLAEALEPAWERLHAAAARFSRRQAAAEDSAGALVVAEAVLRDPEVRGRLLPTKAKELTSIVEALTDAFEKALGAGAEELRSTRRGAAADIGLLGPASDLWPRALGLLVRLAMHLEFRTALPTATPAPEAPAAETPPVEGSDSAPAQPEDAEKAEEAVQKAQARGLAEKVLSRLAECLASAPAREALEAVEAAVSTRANRTGPPAKKARGPALPADPDALLQTHERLLEAVSASTYLHVLRPSAAKGGKSSAATGCAATGGAMDLLMRTLEEHLWRWAAAADELWPHQGGPNRMDHAWEFTGRLLQQAAHADAPTPDVLAAARRLLVRAADAVPSEDSEIKRVLHALFARLEFEPQLVSLAAHLVLGREGFDDEQVKSLAAAAPGAEVEAHPRVAAAAAELVPNFRNLRLKLMPKAPGAEEPPITSVEPGEPAEPPRLSAPSLEEAGLNNICPQPGPEPDVDGESVTSEGRNSEGQRSYSVRSRSPPPQHDSSGRLSGSQESLFARCFDPESLTAAAARAACLDEPGEVGEDVD